MNVWHRCPQRPEEDLLQLELVGFELSNMGSGPLEVFLTSESSLHPTPLLGFDNLFWVH